MPVPFDNVNYHYCSFFSRPIIQSKKNIHTPPKLIRIEVTTLSIVQYYFLFADNPAVGEVLLVMQGFEPYGAVRVRQCYFGVQFEVHPL